MKKLNLGGIAASPSSRPSHPVVDVTDNDMRLLLEQFVVINPQFKTLKNQSETLSKQLGPKIRSLYFERFAGISTDSSTMLVTAGGKTVKLILKESYSTKVQDEAGLIAAIGQEAVSANFRQATVLKLDLAKCPEDKQDAFAEGVLALAAQLGVSDAVSATQCIQPVAGFHDARTTLLTAAQNIAIDAILPVAAYPQL